jgi:molybdenum cofactor synthesis domain-containing protein
MIPLSEAQALVLAACPPSTPGRVPLDEALGHVAAETVLAREPVPPFVNSSMDGYALRSADTDGAGPGERALRLAVVGTIMAGTPLGVPIGPGQSARIMTGAPLPAGSDAVCMLEEVRTEGDGATVVIERTVEAGNFVRHTGQDVDLGDTVLAEGSLLTPARIGVLASQGFSDVAVYPTPRIGVLSTGDELVSGSAPLPPGKIRDANRHTLLALVRREGWEPIDLGICGDDERALEEVLDDAQDRCDAVVTSGGVSVGDLDVVKLALQKRSGGTMRWMQVAIRPAKPLAFGLLDGTGIPVFGLPGNPVSAMVSFELFVRPAGLRMGGHGKLDRPSVTAIADLDLNRRPDGKTHFLRSVVSVDEHGAFHVRPLAGQESHQLSTMAEANGLAVLPDGDGVRIGGRVQVMLVDPGILAVPGSPSLAGPT